MHKKWEIKIEKALKTENPALVLLRTEIILDYNIDKIYNLITNLALWVKWEAILSKMKVLKIFDKNSDLLYVYAKTPVFFLDDWDIV